MSIFSNSSSTSKQAENALFSNAAPKIAEVFAKNSAAPKLNLSEQSSYKKQAQNDKEQNIQYSPKRFSNLLSIMPAGVVLIDHKGIVSLANQQACALLGEPLEGELWRDIIVRAFRPQADDGHEVSMRNGKRVKIDISPLTEEKGQLIVITDLSETRELQHRLSHMQRLSSLGKMVASLAHQVRTPLSSAMLYAENIKSVQAKDSTTERFSQKLILRLKDLESQVNDMLLFAKSGDNHIVKAMSAEQVVNASVQHVEPQFAQAGIELTVINHNKNEPILCNLTALSGAISNLLGNALQAMSSKPDIQAQVRLEVAKQTIEQKSYIVFSVIDNGPGIEEASISRLFEPFYTTKSQGTGLGLAVVNTVAKSHKGFVSCTNRQVETGAIFSLYIPTALGTNEPMQNEISDNSNTEQPVNDENIQGVSA